MVRAVEGARGGAMAAPEERRRRLPALDGLRGLAVSAVIAYHLDPSWLPGGYLGVDIFFVISGFLITGLLIDALAPGSNVRAALKDFWLRRARRLVPALVVMIAVVALAASVLAPDAVPQLRGDVPSALVFMANWRLFFHHDSYFEQWGRPPLLQHLWSLGVEEQFYLVWPWVVLAACRWSRRAPAALMRLAGLGAVASALAMALLYTPGHDGSNVYFNTFTHASGLMAGAAAASFVRCYPLVMGHWRPRARAWMGPAAAGVVVALTVFSASNDTFTYRGGIFLASVATAFALLVALRPGPLSRLLCLRPLRYLGTRSYSLYLWHWPVILLTRPGPDTAGSGWGLLALRLTLTGAVAEASYRWVEQPFRTGRAQEALAALAPRGRRLALGSAAACGVAVVAILVLSSSPEQLSPALAAGSTSAANVVLPPAPGPSSTTTTSSNAPAPRPTTTGSAGTRAPTTLATTTRATTTRATTTLAPRTPTTGGGPQVTAGRSPGPGANGPGVSTMPTTTAQVLIGPRPQPVGANGAGPHARTTTTTAAPHHPEYLAIGDSVLVAASEDLEQRLHNDITVDGQVGRQVYEGLERLAQYRRAGDLKGLKAVIIDLGTNGPMTPGDVAQFRQLCQGVPLLVFVNVRVPRPWQSETNASIAAVAHAPGVKVVDWYSASAAPGVLWPDEIHPDPKGQLLYARLVAKALGL